MKRILFTIILFISSSLIYGQNPDSTSDNNLHKHFISINPLNFFLFQQAGINYEYRPDIIGLEISSGYIYANKLNFSRFFMAGTTNYGPYEFYSGFFLNPQLNFYFSKPKKTSKQNQCYIALKGMYKYLHVDSTEYHIWDNDTGGDYYWFYRKQVDRCKIIGAFLDFGVKCVKNHFVFDFNIGPGLFFINHNMIIAGQGWHDSYMHNTSNVHPPKKEIRIDRSYTVNISFTMGYTF